MKSISRRGFVLGSAGLGAAAMALVGAGCSGGDNKSSNSGSDSSKGGSGELRFVTGGESGTYYAFGSVIAQHATNNAGIKVTALAGNGSQANVQDLEDGNAELAFCQSDVEAYAYDGKNLFDGAPVDMISTVAALYDVAGFAVGAFIAPPRVRKTEVVGLMVSLNRMEVGREGVKAAIDEVSDRYGFPTASIVNMREVTEHLYNREVAGRIVIDDELKAAIDAYYETYGAKA